jgi:carboxypeptidase Q
MLLHTHVPKLTMTSKNLCYETKSGDPAKTLMLGAHVDSVPKGPGINDNCSGVSALMEIAKHLSRFSTANKVRFCFWSGEELGLLGSTFYVSHLTEQERSSITAYLNFDMVAGDNSLLRVMNGSLSSSAGFAPPGSSAVTNIWGEYFEKEKREIFFEPFEGHSDHQPFKDVGIPIGSLATGKHGNKTLEDTIKYGGKVGDPWDRYYHTADDTIDHIDFDAFLTETKAIAHAIAVLSVDVSSVERARKEDKILLKEEKKTVTKEMEMKRKAARREKQPSMKKR